MMLGSAFEKAYLPDELAARPEVKVAITNYVRLCPTRARQSSSPLSATDTSWPFQTS